MFSMGPFFESGAISRRLILVVAFAYALSCFTRAVAAAPAAADETRAIAASLKEKNGTVPAHVRVAGEWALCDEVMGHADGTTAKTGQALLRKVNDSWVVTADLAGPGAATPEALEYHEVPRPQIDRLLDARTRDEMKPVLKLLRHVMPEQYPEGYLLENLAFEENWALCSFRWRQSIHKSDVMGQALLRRSDGGWHLVEQAHHAVDLRQYGIPQRIQRLLQGAV